MRIFMRLAIAAGILFAGPLWGAVPKAIIDLGSPDAATLMTHIQVGDGDTTPATVGGLTCRRNVNAADDNYFYFGIADSFAYQGSRPSVYITFHYYDTGTATLNLNYDSSSDPYKNGGSIVLTNTNTWKSRGFRVTDGYFGNRQNGGADFRVSGPSGTTFYLDMVYARDFCGPNPRVRIHPPPGRPTMNAQATRALMEHMDQWPVTRGLTKMLGDYDHSIPNFTDAELSAFYTQLVASGVGLCMETGAITANGGEEAFNSTKALHDRMIANGGPLDSLVMQEPLTVARYNNWGDEFAANETVDWIQLVRQNYSGIQIGSIEAYPYNNQAKLQWWLTALQDRCAQRGVEGLDYFEIDCDWRIFPGSGNWATVKTLETWCHNLGLAYSVIYWPCPHASSMNDADFWTDINNQGNAYKNAGGAPDEYDIQCWDYIPQTTVPETTSNTFTNGALRFINQYVPRPQTPYNAAISLPGTIQAENYDKGGELVAYHDTTLGNTGGVYRIDNSVDIENTAGGVCNVGWAEAGEWLEYTVNVVSSGSYDIQVRAATPNNGCTFHVEMNGTNVTGTQSVPNTGDWHTWTTKTVSGVALNAGQQILRVAFDAGSWNFDYIYVRSASTPLDPVSAFTATSGDTQNTLSWRNSSDSRFTGTMIRYKTTGYPTSATDGTLVTDRSSNPGTIDSYVHTGRTNGVTYYYSAFAHDSVPVYAVGASASAVPADVLAPGQATAFAATSGNNQNSLSWTNPTASDFVATTIRFRTDTCPASPADGTLLCTRSGAPGSNDSFVHTGLTNGVTYYYSAFSYDEAPNYSTAANASAVPADVTPPAPATALTAIDGAMQIDLSWVNPTDSDFAGTRIMVKTTGYPTGPADGMMLYSGTGSSCVHSSLGDSTTYYYAAYAYDEVPNYSSAATRSLPHSSVYCYADIFPYADGNLSGSSGWSGSATSQVSIEGQTVKINGGAGVYDAGHAVTCGGGPLAVRAKVKKGSGASTIWNMYLIDSLGGDLGKWYGSGTSGRGRIGAGSPTGIGTLTGGWDELYAKIDFAANTTQFVFNGAVLGTPTHAGGESIGSIKFERPDSSSAVGQYVSLDDVTIAAADTTAPSATIGAPSVSVTRTGPVSFTVNFNEPVFGFSAASDVLVNATGTAAGTVVVTGTGPYTVTLSNIAGSGTLGITVKASACTDVAGNANAASSPSATCRVLGSDGRIRDVKDDPNDTPVGLGNKALYLRQSGFAYIEESDRTAGIRVEGVLAGSVGDLVCVSGVMRTSAGGERYVLADAMSTSGTGGIAPLGLSSRALVGDLVCGLYVTAWGKVLAAPVGNSYFISDGSDAAGVRVIVSGEPGVSVGEFVTVRGAAGTDGGRVIYKR